MSPEIPPEIEPGLPIVAPPAVSIELPPSEVASSRRNPFWGWQDVGVFFGISLPILVVAEVTAGAIARAFHVPPDDPAVIVVAQSAAYVVIFALLAVILRIHYDAPFWRSLGWVRSKMMPAAAILSGFCLAFGVAFLGGLLHIQAKDSEITKLLHTTDGAYVLPLFAVTLAPLAEELAFRGFLQPIVVRTVGAVAGITLTGALFGLLHLSEYGRSWGAAAMVTLAGIGFGIIRHVSGSTRSSLWAHAAYNSTLFIAFFSLGGNLKN